MRRVVEHGKGRCPRCGILTDYAFVEYSAGMSYEIRCHSCAHEHVELASPVSAEAEEASALTTTA